MSLLCIKTARRDFNEDISRWDVSSVKAVDFMFDRATSFNGDLSCWDATESNPGLIPLWDAVTSHSPAFASVESQAFRYTESAGASRRTRQRLPDFVPGIGVKTTLYPPQDIL